MKLDGQVVLITGASGGIGRALACRSAGRGARVLVHGRNRDRTVEVADRCGGTALVADLAVPAERASLVRRATAVHGQLDVVINNAGIGWSGPVDASSAEIERAVLELDLAAPIELTRLALPQMIDRDRGWIGFVSSIAGRTGVAGEAVYAAAKAGLDAFAESLRAEAHGTGIGVSVVIPGAVDTGFLSRRGRPYQRTVPRPVAADRVAAALIDSIESEQPEGWVPSWLRVAPVVRSLLPGTYRRLSARFGEPVRLGGRDKDFGRFDHAQTSARNSRDR